MDRGQCGDACDERRRAAFDFCDRSRRPEGRIRGGEAPEVHEREDEGRRREAPPHSRPLERREEPPEGGPRVDRQLVLGLCGREGPPTGCLARAALDGG